MILISEFVGDPLATAGSDRYAHDRRCREYIVSDGNELSWGHTARSTGADWREGQAENKANNFARFWGLCLYYFRSVPKRVFIDLFLPVGYPSSVGKTYLQYQIYDSLQGLCSYLRGVVSTSAVLTAAGVGDSEATAMSAAMAWATKDGLGMVGGLLFSYCASPHFDSHVKEYRLFADIINDVGLTLDMVAPYVGRARVLYIMSIATVCKVMCGISAGATKGCITQHFAIRGNMADLNAKESTQETLVSLLGMIMGIALARYLHHLEQVIDVQGEAESAHFYGGSTVDVVSWSIFIILTIIHIWANFIAVKVLHLRTLNRERATVVLRGVIDASASECIRALREGNSEICLDSPRTDQFIDKIPFPDNVSESLWASTRKLLFAKCIRLDARLNETLEQMTSDDILYYLETEFGDERYILNIVSKISPGDLSWARAKICVTLRLGATDIDQLKAFMHAMVLRRCLDSSQFQKDENFHLMSSRSIKQIITITHQGTNAMFNIKNMQTRRKCLSMEQLADRGWDVKNRLYLGFGPWRFKWEHKKVD